MQRDPDNFTGQDQIGYPEVPLIEIEANAFGGECFPAKDVSMGSCCTAVNAESLFRSSRPAVNLPINTDSGIGAAASRPAQGVKPQEVYLPVPLVPVPSSEEPIESDIAGIEQAASTSSTGICAENEILSTSSSILASVLGEALPPIIEDTGCECRFKVKLSTEPASQKARAHKSASAMQLLNPTLLKLKHLHLGDRNV